MNFWESHREHFDQWLTEAEANQHAMNKLQSELDERKRELDNLEVVLKKRERDVEEAEVNARAAKMAETEKMKASAHSHPVDPTSMAVLNTDEKVVRHLMTTKTQISVIPDSPYCSRTVELIRKTKKLVLSTDVRTGSSEKTRLQFSIGTAAYELRVANPPDYAFDGFLRVTLTPGDEDWTFFTITHLSAKPQYPMPKTTVKVVEEEPKSGAM